MRFLLPAMVLAVLAAPAAFAASDPVIHVHRGGSVLDGTPTFAEETMPAFRHALERERAVLELDVKLSRDRVPVVIHDETLDRTTDCNGAVAERTLDEFLTCRADLLGSGERTAVVAPFITLPTLAEVLAYGRDSGAVLNVEIKNIPGQLDFDPTSAYANTVMDAILASGFPKERLIVQSFWPPNLDVARQRLPGVTLSYLTLNQMNQQGVEFASANGYQWVSPGWPVDAAYVARAHAAGLLVVPYTINDAAGVQEAARIGVDALITDDPVMTRKALGRPEPAADPARDVAGTQGATTRGRTTVRLGVVRRRLRTVRGRAWLPVRVTASGPATVALRALRGRRVLGRRTVRVSAGRRVVGVRVARRALRGRRARVRIRGVAFLASGGSRPLRLTLRLR